MTTAFADFVSGRDWAQILEWPVKLCPDAAADAESETIELI